MRRGLPEPERARAFLAAEENHPPEAFAGIDAAVASISRHLAADGRITMHGDYDVDGVCSTAMLVRALRELGGDVDWYLPDRPGDGYGLPSDTVGAWRRAARAADHRRLRHHSGRGGGPRAGAGNGRGRHRPSRPARRRALPAAPIVHPAVCGYPCAELCATAVACKLAQALWQTGRQVRRRALGTETYRAQDDLDLVALATIADVVPLTGENSTLVRRGLRALGSTTKPGLRALMAVAQVDPTGSTSARWASRWRRV